MSKWKKHVFVEGEFKKWWNLFYFKGPLEAAGRFRTMVKFSLAERDDDRVFVIKRVVLIDNNTGELSHQEFYQMSYSSMLEAVMMSRKLTESFPKRLFEKISKQEYTNEIAIAAKIKHRIDKESLRQKEKAETLKSEGETEIIKTIETPKRSSIISPVIKWFKTIITESA